MAHKKLQRFAEISNFPNVFQYPSGMQGKWYEVFGSTTPITLELACGKGEYTVALAAKYPERAFIGVDIKGNRLWKGASIALKNKISNAVFLRTQIEKITDYFAPKEVDEIWITFPDPQLRLSRAKKRLTHPRFLKEYHKILIPEGKIHLKTDSPELYNFTKTVIQYFNLKLRYDIPDVYSPGKKHPDLYIQTYYESLDIAGSKQIYYLCFSLPDHWEKDENAFNQHVKEKYGHGDIKAVSESTMKA